jgi:hypothetical protein
MLALYHYSTALHLPFILRAGALIASREDAHGVGHRGVLWFSTNAHLERTVVKRMAGGVVPPYVRWQVVDAAQTLRWPAIGRAAGYRATTIRGLERAGRVMGGVPSEWWGQFEVLPLDRVASLEVRCGARWLEIDTHSLRVEAFDRAGHELLRLSVDGATVCEVARLQTGEGEWAYATHAATARFDRLIDAAEARASDGRALALG